MDPFLKKFLAVFAIVALFVVIVAGVLVWFVANHKSELFAKPYSKEAIQRYDRLVKACPTDPRAWHDRGTWYWRHSNPKKALSDFTQAITLAPTHADWYRDRASVYSNLLDYESAAADYTKSIQLDPQTTTTWTSRAWVLERLGRLDEASRDFDQAIKLQPSLVLYNQRGDFLCRNQRFESALQSDNEAIEFKDPKKTSSWVRESILKRRARIQVKMHRPELAISDFTRVLAESKNPNYEDAYMARARVYERMGKHQECKVDCASYLKSLSDNLGKSPQSGSLWNYRTRAWLYRTEGETEKSNADMNTIVTLATQRISKYPNSGLYTARAAAYDWLGKPDLAAIDRNKAIEMVVSGAHKNGGSFYTHSQLAAMLQHGGKDAKAIEEYTEAIRLYPTSGYYYASRARSWLAIGKKDQALSDALKSIQLGAALPGYVRLAEVYEALGKHHEAVAAADTALVLDDDCISAYETQAKAFNALKLPDQAKNSLALARLCMPEADTTYDDEDDED